MFHDPGTSMYWCHLQWQIYPLAAAAVTASATSSFSRFYVRRPNASNQRQQYANKNMYPHKSKDSNCKCGSVGCKGSE
jgi:hypothetical protein